MTDRKKHLLNIKTKTKKVIKSQHKAPWEAVTVSHHPVISLSI